MDISIINATYEFVDEIKNSDEYKAFKEIEKSIFDLHKPLVDKFKIAKDKFEEAQKYGDSYPGYKELAFNLSQIKMELYSTKEMKKYLELKKIIQNKLDELSFELNNIVKKNGDKND